MELFNSGKRKATEILNKKQINNWSPERPGYDIPT